MIGDGSVVDLCTLIPGLRDALHRQDGVRIGAFWDAPKFICGIEVKPLSLAHFVTLHEIKSPLVVGGNVGIESIGLFFWVVSPDYQRALESRDRDEAFRSAKANDNFAARRDEFIARLRPLNRDAAVKAIEAYLDEALQDAPKGSGKQTGAASDWSWIAGTLSLASHATNDTTDDLMHAPVARVMQFARIGLKRLNPDAMFENPSDELRGDWLTKINEDILAKRAKAEQRKKQRKKKHGRRSHR